MKLTDLTEARYAHNYRKVVQDLFDKKIGEEMENIYFVNNSIKCRFVAIPDNDVDEAKNQISYQYGKPTTVFKDGSSQWNLGDRVGIMIDVDESGVRLLTYHWVKPKG